MLPMLQWTDHSCTHLTALIELGKIFFKKKEKEDMTWERDTLPGILGKLEGAGVVGKTESYFSVFVCKILDDYFFNFSKQYSKKLLWLRSMLTGQHGDRETRSR